MEWQLKVQQVGPLQSNAVLLTAKSPDGGEAILIDPGDDPEVLTQLIESSGCRLTAILATHGHFDHIGAAAELQKSYPLPVRCHKDDIPMINQMPQVQVSYGLPASAVPECDASLVDGMKIPFAGGDITVSHIPGHSPGQLMFVLSDYAFVGDCLFAGSVGRTDLPGSDFATLEKSIRERIYALPDHTIVVPGHGPDTTVGEEKATNPFVRG